MEPTKSNTTTSDTTESKDTESTAASSNGTNGLEKGAPGSVTALPLGEGSTKGWLTVLGAWLMQFATFGYVYSFGVFQDFYSRIYLTSNTPSDISWIGGVSWMLSLGLGLVSGKLFDMGYFYALVIGGSSLFIFSLFMLTLAKPDQFYQIFLTQGIGMGLGIGFTFVPTLGVVIRHFFRKNRALAAGIALSGAGCGGVVFPIMINHLLLSHSFGVSVRASGYVVAGCLVTSLLLMRTQNLPPLAPGSSPVKRPPLLSFFKEVPYSLLVLGSSLCIVGIYFPVFYMQLYSVQHHVDSQLAFYSLAIINGMSTVGRVSANYLSDRAGPFNTVVVCGAFTGSTIWAVLGVHDRATLAVVSVFYGYFSGAVFSLLPAAHALIAKSPAEIGIRSGLAFSFNSIGILIAGPIQGALLGTRFNWIRPVAFSAIMVYIASFIILIARMVLSRQRGAQRV